MAEDGDELREEGLYEAEEGESEIQAALDIGYDQLDGFVNWLEETLDVDTRTAQQDAFNAESLLDFLANQYRKTATEANEFEIRWFLFSHYLRRANADPEIEERLPDSLRRFYAYLEAEHGFTVPLWLHHALEERAYFHARRQDFAELAHLSEHEWEEGFQAWCRELEEDLDARALWLPRELGDGMAWGEGMGWREATLQEDANRFWQERREELLEQGMDTDSARARLLDEYLLWVDTPQERLEHRAPREVIREERMDSSESD